MSVENKPKYYVIMWKFLQPAAHKPELPAEKVDKEYSRLRRQVFWGIFIGYAGYYLVRKNFSIAMPALESMGYDKADLGWALSAVSPTVSANSSWARSPTAATPASSSRWD